MFRSTFIFVLLCLAFVSHLLERDVCFVVKIKQINTYQLSLSISNLSVVFFQNSLQLCSFGFFFLLKGWHGDMLGRADKSTEIGPHKPSCTLKHVYTRTNRYQPATLAQSFMYLHTLSTFHIPNCSIKCLKLTSMYATISKKNPPTNVFRHTFNPRHV